MNNQRRNNYRRNNRTYNNNRNKRYIRKQRGGRTKDFVDGKQQRMIQAGITSIPYLIKSVGLLKSLINTEPKFLDTTFTSTVLGTTVLYSRLTAIGQGLTDSSRIGNKILLKDVFIRYTIVMNSAAATTMYRAILFVDKETDGASPTSPSPLALNSTESPIDMDESKRFVIIRDQYIPLSINGDRVCGEKIYSELNFHCEFDGTGNGIGDAKENQIWLAFLSSDNTNQSTVNAYSRIKYYDS